MRIEDLKNWTVDQLQIALDVLVDRYANFRKIHGVS